MILKGWNELWIGPRFFSGPNMIVDSGHELGAKMLAGLDQVSHLAMGSDPAETTPDMVALGNEVSSRRSITSLAEGSRTIFEYEFTTTSQYTLAEFGLFNSSVEGDLFARWIITPFLTPANTTILGRWYITVGPN